MCADKSYQMQEVYEVELMCLLVHAGNFVIFEYIQAAGEFPDMAQKTPKRDLLLVLDLPFCYSQQVQTPLPLDLICRCFPIFLFQVRLHSTRGIRKLSRRTNKNCPGDHRLGVYRALIICSCSSKACLSFKAAT